MTVDDRPAPTLAPLALAMVLTACRAAGSTGIPEARADEPVPAPRAPGVAVVELFTSEGCSSCPPADAVLADLAGQNRPVYTLAFHVDYWDELGWSDPFASSINTDRQRAYARSFGASGMYTPQMIVNGVEQFTGSDRAHADQSIARALSHPQATRLSIRTSTASTDAFAVAYDTYGAPADSFLDVALVERSTSTDVRTGENAGRTLHHANVVRGFTVVSLSKPMGSVTVHLPPSLQRANADVIAYVQRPADSKKAMEVLAAARVPVSSN